MLQTFKHLDQLYIKTSQTGELITAEDVEFAEKALQYWPEINALVTELLDSLNDIQTSLSLHQGHLD